MGRRKKKKSNPQPNFEFLIIFVFVLSFLTWASIKCNKTKRDLQGVTALAAPNNPVDTAAIIASMQSRQAIAALPLVPQAVAPAQPQVQQVQVAPQIIRERVTPLYVNVDSLNFRAGPSLNNRIVGKLPLHAEITFLNEVSSTTERIRMPWGITDEPWVKIKYGTQIGWVYGAGVHYYKIDRDFPE